MKKRQSKKSRRSSGSKGRKTMRGKLSAKGKKRYFQGGGKF